MGFKLKRALGRTLQNSVSYNGKSLPSLTAREVMIDKEDRKKGRKDSASEFAVEQSRIADEKKKKKEKDRIHALTRGDPNTFTNQARLGEPNLGRQRLLS